MGRKRITYGLPFHVILGVISIIAVGWVLISERAHFISDTRHLAEIHAHVFAEHVDGILGIADAEVDDAAALETATVATGDSIARIDTKNLISGHEVYGPTDVERIVVYDMTGRILGLWPQEVDDEDPFGRLNIASDQLFDDSKATFETRSSVVSHRALSEYPYRLMVSFNKAAVLRPWRRRASTLVTLYVLLFAMIAVTTRKTEGEIRTRLWVEQQLREEQLRYLERLRTISGGLAHQMNNLLTVILGNAGILGDIVVEDQEAGKFVTAIKKSTYDAAGLTSKMLAVAGNSSVYRTLLTIGELADDLRKTLRHEYGDETTASLIVNATNSDTSIRIDRNLIRIAVVDLVANAVEGMAGEHGTVTVTVRVSDDITGSRGKDLQIKLSGDLPAPPCLTIAVGDDGPGVSRDAFNHLFEPFATTRFIGRGLGLPALAGIARQHGGAVRVETATGEGTTVTLILPLATQDAISAPVYDI